MCEEAQGTLRDEDQTIHFGRGAPGTPVAYTLADPPSRASHVDSAPARLESDLTPLSVDVRLRPRQNALAAEP